MEGRTVKSQGDRRRSYRDALVKTCRWIISASEPASVRHAERIYPCEMHPKAHGKFTPVIVHVNLPHDVSSVPSWGCYPPLNAVWSVWIGRRCDDGNGWPQHVKGKVAIFANVQRNYPLKDELIRVPAGVRGFRYERILKAQLQERRCGIIRIGPLTMSSANATSGNQQSCYENRKSPCGMLLSLEECLPTTRSIGI